VRNRTFTVISSLLYLALVSCQPPKPSGVNSKNASTKPHVETDTSQYRSVSLISLIATPERYDNQKIYVEGFMHLGFEDNGLYLNETDYKNSIMQNSLWVKVSREQAKQFAKAQNKYVVIKGTFNGTFKGHEDMWSGSLDKVISVDTLQSFY
jgi:hypothetical protein